MKDKKDGAQAKTDFLNHVPKETVPLHSLSRLEVCCSSSDAFNYFFIEFDDDEIWKQKHQKDLMVPFRQKAWILWKEQMDPCFF